MKNISLILLLLGTLTTGCDRDTLKGLNLKINAEVKSDYDGQAEVNQETQPTNNPTVVENNQPESTTAETQAETKLVRKTVTDDPDAPLDFKAIQDCSKAGIKAKTNEIYYAENSQVKSIDSKNEKQVKQWKKIYAQVSQSCNQ